jgi:hypothetical protein
MKELFFTIGATKGGRLHLDGVAAISVECALDLAGGQWRGTSGTAVDL